MAYAKHRRQQAIAGIIRSASISSQQELSAHLAEQGFAATQATVSRDLEQVGAIKVRRSGRIVYALPPETVPSTGPRYRALLRQYAVSIEAAGNLVVIRTPPGSAHLIGVALDQSPLDDVAGTICGDDTIFVACRNDAAAQRLAKALDE